jgi:hypothetical protein
MSKRNHGEITINGRYLALRHQILDCPAWKAMSFGARLLYIALHRQLIYKDNNNGKLHLSSRDAAEEIGTRQVNIGQWYRELEHYGFIVMTSGPYLGIEGKGRAARWRITDHRHGKDFDGTKNYLKWDGTLFEKPRRLNSPPSKSRPSKPKKSQPSKTEPRSAPSFRVKRTPLHEPEAHPASGKPESEAHPASCGGGSGEAHPASYLDKPYVQPDEGGGSSERAGKPPTVGSNAPADSKPIPRLADLLRRSPVRLH